MHGALGYSRSAVPSQTLHDSRSAEDCDVRALRPNTRMFLQTMGNLLVSVLDELLVLIAVKLSLLLLSDTSSYLVSSHVTAKLHKTATNAHLGRKKPFTVSSGSSTDKKRDESRHPLKQSRLPKITCTQKMCTKKGASFSGTKKDSDWNAE